jgi:hypothetical protein
MQRFDLLVSQAVAALPCLAQLEVNDVSSQAAQVSTSSLNPVQLLYVFIPALYHFCFLSGDPVNRADIVARLLAQGVSTEDAEQYADAFLESKEHHLEKMDVAIGDRSVVLEAFQKWKAELLGGCVYDLFVSPAPLHSA